MRGERILQLMVVVCACVFLQTSSLYADDRKSEYLDLRRLIGKEKFKDAIERCKELIEKYPDYFYLYETLAEVSQYAGDLDNAMKYFEKRIEEGREVGLTYYGLARVNDYKKNYRSAVLLYHKATEFGVDVPECYRDYEYAYEKFEGLESAIRYFSSLCHRNPENANYWYSFALAYWGKDDLGKTIQCLEEALLRRKGEAKYLEAKMGASFLHGPAVALSDLRDRLLPLAHERADIDGAQFLQFYLSYSY
ncbi:MAG: hypothetical protein AABZ61_08850, partial [Bacteroidota bacterium]